MVSSTQNKPFSRLEYIDQGAKGFGSESIVSLEREAEMQNYWRTASVEFIALQTKAPYIAMGLGKRSLWRRVVSFIKGVFNG